VTTLEVRRTLLNSTASGGRCQTRQAVTHLVPMWPSRQYYTERAAGYITSSESASLTSSECSMVQPSVHRRGEVKVVRPEVACVFELLDELRGHPASVWTFLKRIRWMVSSGSCLARNEWKRAICSRRRRGSRLAGSLLGATALPDLVAIEDMI
jgi:hypothetical protein